MYRILIISVSLLTFTLSNFQSDSFAQNNVKSDTLQSVSEKKVIEFLDSIKNLDTEKYVEGVSKYSDSIFNSQKQLNTIIEINDYKNLINSCSNGYIKVKEFKKLFPDENIDISHFMKGHLPVIVYKFSKDKFALQFDNYGWECNVYFFDKNKIVAKHFIRHRYGLEIEHFIDNDSNIVIYYKQNFASGTDISWWNYNFFKYYNNSLLPVLNELKKTTILSHSNSKSIYFESEISKTNPLTLKMSYSIDIPDISQTSKNSYETIIEDSTEITYNWDNNLKQYFPNYRGNKLNKYKILSMYFYSNEILFIKTHMNEIENLLNGKDAIKRNATLNYLDRIINKE